MKRHGRNPRPSGGEDVNSPMFERRDRQAAAERRARNALETLTDHLGHHQAHTRIINDLLHHYPDTLEHICKRHTPKEQQ